MTTLETVVVCAVCQQRFCTHCVEELKCPQCGSEHYEGPYPIEYKG